MRREGRGAGKTCYGETLRVRQYESGSLTSLPDISNVDSILRKQLQWRCASSCVVRTLPLGKYQQFQEPFQMTDLADAILISMQGNDMVQTHVDRKGLERTTPLHPPKLQSAPWGTV